MSNDFDLTQVAENQNNKYLSINTAIAQLAGAVGGILDVDMTGGNETLTLTQYRRSSLFRCDPGATPRTLTLPPVMRFAFFGNVGSAEVTVEMGSTQIPVPAGTIILAWSDGTADGLQSVAGGGGGAGAFTDLSDVPSSYSGQANKLVQVNAGESGLEFTDPNAVSTIAFDLSFFVGGDLLDGELVFRFVATREFTLPAGLGGSEAWCDTYSTATGSVQFAILRNNALIGTINFAAGAEQATFTFAADVTFDPEDILDVIAPSPADATLQNVTVTLAGTRPGVGSTNGIPVGGAAGQALLKQSGTDYDADWGDPVPNGSVTNAKLATMAEATFKMRAAASGTGAPIDGSASQLRTAAGLVIGTDVLAYSQAADAIRALTPEANRFPYFTGPSAAALARIESGTWTPGITFATPGTMSVSFTTQEGAYRRIGDIVTLTFQVRCAITHGTGTGTLRITNAPFECLSGVSNSGRAGAMSFFNGATTWPSGTSKVYAAIAQAQTFIVIQFDGSAMAAVSLTNANTPVAPAELWIAGSISYIAAA